MITNARGESKVRTVQGTHIYRVIHSYVYSGHVNEPFQYIVMDGRDHYLKRIDAYRHGVKNWLVQYQVMTGEEQAAEMQRRAAILGGKE